VASETRGFAVGAATRWCSRTATWICGDQQPGGCLPNFDQDPPRLADGQASELSGFRCLAQGAVTCTLTKGEHAGKGFGIDVSAVVEVSPPG
jgi:hypothetical protein